MCKPERMPKLVHERYETEPACGQSRGGPSRPGDVVCAPSRAVSGVGVLRRFMQSEEAATRSVEQPFDKIGLGIRTDLGKRDIRHIGPLLQRGPVGRLFRSEPSHRVSGATADKAVQILAGAAEIICNVLPSGWVRPLPPTPLNRIEVNIRGRCAVQRYGRHLFPCPPIPSAAVATSVGTRCDAISGNSSVAG